MKQHLVAQPSDTEAGGIGEGSPASSRTTRSRRSLWLGWTIAASVLAPPLLAVWIIPGFMTQDGPTHLYNAWILTRSFDAQFSLPRLLRGAVAALAELVGSSGSGLLAPGGFSLVGRSHHDQPDTRGLCRLAGLAPLAHSGTRRALREQACWPRFSP